MKKIILSTLLLITTIAGTGQHTNALRDLNKTDYLKKSKNQKTAAWILAGAGAGTLILGLTRINVAGSNSGTVNNTTGYVLLATGFAAGISSIPLFAASKRNKKKVCRFLSEIILPRICKKAWLFIKCNLLLF